MLTFEQADGRSVSFRYSDFRNVRYIPDDTVRLRFVTSSVVVRGCNLLPLWQALPSRRVSLLRPGTEAEGLMRAEVEPYIGSITVTPAVRPE